LAVKRLELSRVVLETSVLDRQWQELIFLFPKNFELWRFYLRFVSSYFTSFSAPKAVAAYVACFAKLRQVQAQSFLTPERPPDLEAQMRRALVDLAHFLASAGFRERAVALFQAMGELNLFSPPLPGYYSLEDKLALFEPFWESGVARFGEPGVAGWAKVMEDKDKPLTCYAPDSLSNDSEWEDKTLTDAGSLVDKASLWLELELGRERRHWLPWRSSEEEAEDPDRAVSFEDVSPFLFQFNEADQRLHLTLNFLHFLGAQFDDESFFPTTLRSETVQAILGQDTTETLGPDLASWAPQISAGVLQRTKPDPTDDPTFASFCRNVLSQATRALQGHHRTQMATLWLRFEVWMCLETGKQKAKIKEVKTLAAEMLKDDQKNMVLYAEFARAEYKLNGLKAAWKVLKMAMLAAAGDGKASPYLYLTAVGILLSERRSEGTIAVDEDFTWLLALAATDKPYSSSAEITQADILNAAAEARQMLKDKLAQPDNSLGTDEEINGRPVTFVPKMVRDVFYLCWLTYQAESTANEAAEVALDAIATIESWTSRAARLCAENLHKIRLDLLSLAAKDDKAILRLSKAALRSALAAFPCSPCILGGLCDLDVQPTVVDATWRQFTNTLTSKGEATPLPYVHAVKVLVKQYARGQDEVKGQVAGAATYLYRAQALLETFVSREPCRYSPLVWRLHLWVTYQLESLKESGGDVRAVSTVFYRGLQDCPASKGLYLDMVQYEFAGKRDDKAKEGLQGVLDVLGEKEGRWRLPLEELEVLLEKEEGEDEVKDDED